MNRHGLSGIGQKKNRASGRLSLTLLHFFHLNLYFCELCAGFSSPASLTVSILLLCHLFLLHVLVFCFFFSGVFFFYWLELFQRNGGRGALRQTQIERRGKGKHRVFLIGEPEGRGMDGRKRGERGNSCPCWGALQH